MKEVYTLDQAKRMHEMLLLIDRLGPDVPYIKLNKLLKELDSEY